MSLMIGRGTRLLVQGMGGAGTFHTDRSIAYGTEVVGAVRLHATGAPGTVELGIWLGRSSRGQGVGPRAVARAVETARAAGATVLLARTTTGNRAARALLASLGAHETVAGDDVTARIPLRPRSLS